MTTRNKMLLINICLILLTAILVVGGAVLSLYLIDKSNATDLDFEEIQGVRDLLAGANEDNARYVSSLTTKLPEGYGLVWLDKQNRIYKDENLQPTTIKLVIRYLAKGKAQDVGTYFGNVILCAKMTNSTLVVVDTSGAFETQVTMTLLVYGLVAMALMFAVFLVTTLVEGAFVFPKLGKLRHAMNEVYNGNYTQVVRLRPGKRLDDVSQLLMEFDRLRRRIADATKAKEDADRERGVMISGISHDLRTPLTVIQVHAKGLVDGVAQKMGKTEQYYDNIYSTACSMLSLVNKLAEFSKVETHTVTYSFVERDLGLVVQEYVNNHYIPYAARGLKFKLKLPKGRPLWVNLDKEQFLRVLQNICDNSLKYKDKETCTMFISAEIQGDEVVLRLSDDGPGIGDFETEYIFESYYRGDPSRTNPISGSGLGLSIVKNIILAHKGQIVAYNNNGLTIEICLPYRRKK